MTDTFEDHWGAEPAILESEGKAAFKVLERNESPGEDGIPIYLL